MKPARVDAGFEVDPRVELIAAVETLASGNPCPGGEESDYLLRVRRALPRDHEACRLFAAMTPADWRHRHPSLILLDFSAPPELAVAAHPEHYRERGRGDALSRLLPELRRFARDAFAPFFASEAGYHAELRAQARSQFDPGSVLAPLQDYVGPTPPHRYHYLLAPLFHGGAVHNVLYRRDDGVYDIYSISGHDRVAAGAAQLALSGRGLAVQSWHEILHTMVDALTQRHRAALEPLAPLYGLMTATARDRYRGPQGWLHIVDEHVIRAMTSRLAGRVFGEEFGASQLAHEKAEGFALVGVVYEALLEYQTSRAAYPTLADFYPRLVETLQRLGSRLPGGGRAR